MSPAERARVDAAVVDLMTRSAAPRIVADMWSAMQSVANADGEFSANEVRALICPDGREYMWRLGDPGVDCDPRRVVGAVYRTLASAGLIERTGRLVENSDTIGHNGGRSHQLPVWRICSWERPQPVAARVTATPAGLAEDDWLFGDLDVPGSAPRLRAMA